VTTPLLPISAETAARLRGRPLVIMLDVDGTLAPIAPRPELAVVSPEIRRTIAALATCRDVHVALVSGRAAADARRMVGVASLWVIGNHGYQVTDPDGAEHPPDPKLEGQQQTVAHAARRIEPLVRTVPGVIFEDKGWTLSIHYRLAPREVIPRLRATVSEVADAHGLRVGDGKEVLEVRPSARVDKGTAVLQLGARLGGFAADASLIFVGDDTTDEDAFRAIRHKGGRAVTVRVHEDAGVATAAEYRVRDPGDVRELLEWLLAERRPERPLAAPVRRSSQGR
jgi:trehalose 6-phosphate phosphatase